MNPLISIGLNLIVLYTMVTPCGGYEINGTIYIWQNNGVPKVGNAFNASPLFAEIPYNSLGSEGQDKNLVEMWSVL